MNSSHDNPNAEIPKPEIPGAAMPLSEVPPEEKQLLAGMTPRIVRTTLVLGVAGSVLFWIWRGAGWGGGFAVGAALSALNFQWMHSAIGAVADMAVAEAVAGAASAAPSDAAGPNTHIGAAQDAAQDSGQDPVHRKAGSSGAVPRFVLRYALIALAGYVIFRSSVLSLPAFFAGLFVAIAAVLAEIVYQVGRGFRSPKIYG